MRGTFVPSIYQLDERINPMLVDRIESQPLVKFAALVRFRRNSGLELLQSNQAKISAEFLFWWAKMPPACGETFPLLRREAPSLRAFACTWYRQNVMRPVTSCAILKRRS